MKYQLSVSNPTEAQAQWEQVGSNPGELAAWFQRVFTVEIPNGEINSDFIIGSVEPTSSDDKNKVWINNGSVPFISIPQNGGQASTKIYPYPPYVPLIWTRGNDAKPSYLRQLSETELQKMSLTTPEDTGYYYVIFEP